MPAARPTAAAPRAESSAAQGGPSASSAPSAPSVPSAPDTVRDVIGWGVFGCLLVPVVLLWCGAPPVTAAGAGLGLTAVTGTCWALLRHFERAATKAERQTPVD
ncbi:hypothetical protein [Streptomyces sp. LaPpAH-108]|uniref:hypothetical protein n=1 Tax=Streptomyces sp. LaPpAH-108 TaxID=1155714 RepID=UPI0003626D85|nr:hypothetical protein [Streptomyces sp. LaPpAH-108]